MSYPFDWVEDLIKSHVVATLPDMVDSMAWKNWTFDPEPHSVWLKIINSPVTEEAITLGPTGENELRGFLQIGIYCKLNTGISASKEVYGRLSGAFKVSDRLAGPTTDSFVKVTSKGYSQGGQTSAADFTKGGTEGVWDADYITIYWLAREPKQRT